MLLLYQIGTPLAQLPMTPKIVIFLAETTMSRILLSAVTLLVLLLTGCQVILEETPQPLPVEPIFTIPLTQTAAIEPILEPNLEPTQVRLIHALPTATPEPGRPFAVLADAPIQTMAFLHTDKGCNWMGVAGQVFGYTGDPLTDIIVIVVGNAGGKRVDALGFSGMSPGYGPAGFEIKLSDTVAPGIFWVQIFDLAGRSLTDPFSFQMVGGCEKNLTIINFRQQQPNYRIVLPLVQR